MMLKTIQPGRGARHWLCGGILILCVLFSGTACSPADPRAESDAEIAPPFRMLLVGDPFALSMERLRPRMEAAMGFPIRIELVGYNDGRRLILLNSRDRESRYDLIALDIVWLGELTAQNLLRDLSQSFAAEADRFLPSAVAASSIDGRLYALPVQPHAELLWVRSDLLASVQLPPPQTTEDVLTLARRLHAPEQGQFGIAWNAQRGQPLGQTMAHLFAAFGQPLLTADQRHAAFETPLGLQAAEYAMALSTVAPPDILSMAWDQRTSRFAEGATSMTYGWGARAYITEQHPTSRVTGKVQYLPAPHAPGAPPATPLGVWSLAIPANSARQERAIFFLQWFFQESVQRELVEVGHGSPSLMTLITDPEIQQRHPVLRTLQELHETEALNFHMRPRIPEWDAIADILGTEFHEMLTGTLTPDAALRQARIRIDQLLQPTATP